QVNLEFREGYRVVHEFLAGVIGGSLHDIGEAVYLEFADGVGIPVNTVPVVVNPQSQGVNDGGRRKRQRVIQYIPVIAGDDRAGRVKLGQKGGLKIGHRLCRTENGVVHFARQQVIRIAINGRIGKNSRVAYAYGIGINRIQGSA